MPPADVVQQLAREWDRSAHHEAGHCLAMAHLDLPVSGVELKYQSHRGGEWSVAAKTSCDDSANDDVDGLALSCLAGPMAEAVWHHRVEGVNLRAACRHAQQANRRDAAALRGYLRASTLRPDRADEQALDLVTRYWSRIGRIAAELMDQQRLTRNQIRRLAGVPE